MIQRGTIQITAVLILAGLLLTGLTACNPKPKVTDKQVKIIDDVQVAELMLGDKPVLLIDARPDYRYRLGHLPGAINIPLPQLQPDDPRLTEGVTLIVYGDKPQSTLSHAAAKKLLANLRLTVLDYRGGIEMWKQAGRKLESDG